MTFDKTFLKLKHDTLEIELIDDLFQKCWVHSDNLVEAGRPGAHQTNTYLMHEEYGRIISLFSTEKTIEEKYKFYIYLTTCISFFDDKMEDYDNWLEQFITLYRDTKIDLAGMLIATYKMRTAVKFKIHNWRGDQYSIVKALKDDLEETINKLPHKSS